VALIEIGPVQKVLTRVGLGQFFVAWVESGRVSYLWFGFGYGKFPLKILNLSIFFPLGQKISSGRVK